MVYRSGPELGRCLDSIAGEADEIVVVDNGGETSVPEGVRLISPGANLGFTAGANLGAHEAREDVLVFLNPARRPRSGSRWPGCGWSSAPSS